MLFVTFEISGSLVSKMRKISRISRKINKFYSVAPKYVSMKKDIGINV